MVQSMLTGLHGIDIITPGTSTVGYVQDFDTDSFGRFQFASNTASDKRLLLCLDSLPTHSPLITEKVVWTSLLSARRWQPAYQHWANPIWHTDLRATAKLMIFYHNKQDLYEKISIPSDFNIQTTKKSTFAYFFAEKFVLSMIIRIFASSVLAKPLNNAQIVRGVFCLYSFEYGESYSLYKTVWTFWKSR